MSSIQPTQPSQPPHSIMPPKPPPAKSLDEIDKELWDLENDPTASQEVRDGAAFERAKIELMQTDAETASQVLGELHEMQQKFEQDKS
jgi:hypothetical protein